MLPKRDSLTSPDPVTRQLESQVESISDTIIAVDAQLYHSQFNEKDMIGYFLSISQRANQCAQLLKHNAKDSR